MKSYKLIIAAGVLLLTACQTKHPPAEGAAVYTEPVTAKAPTQAEVPAEESAASKETAQSAAESGLAGTDTFRTDAAGRYEVKDIAGAGGTSGHDSGNRGKWGIFHQNDM